MSKIETYTFSIEALQTKREVTNDLVNIKEEDWKKLDERGLVKKGTYVVRGDILVGCLGFETSNEDPPERCTNSSFRMTDASGRVSDTRVTLTGPSGEILAAEVDVDLAASAPPPAKRDDQLARPLGDFETSVFSSNVFAVNSLRTVGDLVALGEVGFYEACQAYQKDSGVYESTFPAKALKEVKGLMQNYGVLF